VGVKRQKAANHIVCPNCKIAKKALKDSKIHYRGLNSNIYELFVGDNGVGISNNLDINNGTNFSIKFKGEN